MDICAIRTMDRDRILNVRLTDRMAGDMSDNSDFLMTILRITMGKHVWRYL